MAPPESPAIFDDAAYVHAASNAEAVSRFTGNPEQALVYALPFLAFAAAAWIGAGRSRDGIGFLAFAFPREVYLRRSSFVDLQVFLANRLVVPVIAALGASATALVAAAIARGLDAVLPSWSGSLSPEGWPMAAGFTLGLALAYDFATYVSHRLHHGIPRLWALHKLHHSAKVLSPLTAFRHHPGYEAISEGLDVLLVGPFLGLAFYLLSGPTDALAIFGVHIVFVAFQLMGAGLRHSHMWLSFGPYLERIVISPAQHQIHHSEDPRHFDRNFGEVFAIWDWMFGTLYLPREREELTFGLGDADPHRNLRAAWVGPLREALARSHREPDGAPGV